MDKTTYWLELLATLRPHLKGRDTRGKKGSLRWLEAVIAERGGRPGTVRNILYKDLGSSDEKIRLFELLSELYEDAGLSAPDAPSELSAAAAKRLLGRDKRLIFARFTRDLAAGAVPQLVVVGGPATGKGVLLEQVRAHVDESLFVNLAQDLAPALYTLVAALGLEPTYERLLAQLSPAQPFAVQAALQDELRTLLADGLNQARLPLLVRAQADATLAGLPLRDAESREVELSHWLEPLLTRLRVPYLVACSSAPATLDYKLLRQPSRDEARRYLRQRLPDASDPQLESLLNRGGRSYGELSRLVLLEISRAGTQGEDRLLSDPQLGPLLRILAALSPEADPEIPVPLLEKVVGKSLSALTQAERALLEPLQGDTVRPVLRTLLPFERSDKTAHQVAFDHYQTQNTPFRTLYHAYHAGEYSTLVERIDRDPSNLALLPGLWAEASKAEGWPTALREQLAVVVVRYRAVLGDYRHPEAQGALAYLSDSDTPTMSAWAKVKQAEAHIDAGRYAEAEALVTDLPPLEGDARAEALLVDAALARWHGTYERAERLVAQALALPAAPLLESRARLWQGLVAKDAGRFGEALSSLEQVRDNPLLAGRARYQEGDLLMRLGRPDEGARRIEAGLEQLADAAPAEERARVRARLGTVLRRLGRYDDAAQHLYQALGTAPDPFTRARIASEASILESARDRPRQALKLASEAETVFRNSDARPEEARYRYLRTLYRLAVAYWSWRSGQPYRPPFRGGPVIAQAKTILKRVLDDVGSLAQNADRYAALYLDVCVTLSLMLPPRKALSLLETATTLESPYLRTVAQLASAEAHLRQDDAPAAAACLATLRQLPPEPGLHAWKAGLDAEMMLLLGQPGVACEVIDEGLRLPAAFRAQLGWVWGQMLSERNYPELAERWLEPHSYGPLGLPEALALHFEQHTSEQHTSEQHTSEQHPKGDSAPP